MTSKKRLDADLARIRRAMLRPALLLVPLLLLNPVPASFAACVEPDDGAIPSIALQEVARGLENPVHVAHAGDGSGRLFVVEQPGRVRILENGRLHAEAFIDISERVSSGGEKGLLSIAFHPRYAQNGLFYLNYTTRDRGLHTIVSEWKRRSRDAGDPASERVLLRIEQPYANHNGGQLAFGPDAYLYIGMGDGGAANDPLNHGQRPETLLGALLRIDVDRRSHSLPYVVPADNPFVDRSGHRAEVWAYGLRNPWRFSFDTATGRLFLADVGQDEEEEIDVVRKGGNYGWRIMEGAICTPAVNLTCDKSGLELPIFTYLHPEGFSITGGFVYRGAALPALCGVYVYADYVSERIWGLRYDGSRVTRQRELLRARFPISSFGEDERGELYVADHRSGRVLKIVPAASR